MPSLPLGQELFTRLSLSLGRGTLRNASLVCTRLAAVAVDSSSAMLVLVIVADLITPLLAIMVSLEVVEMMVVMVAVVVMVRRDGGLLAPPLSLGLLLLLNARMLLVLAVLLVLLHSTEDAFDRGSLQKALEHTTGASVLQAFVGREGVLRAVATVAKLAHVQRIRLLVLVLEVALKRIVAGEGAPAVRALLGLVYTASRGRRHSI